MQKLLGILLFCCLSAPLVGTYAGLCIEKYQVKKEIKNRMLAGIPDSNLVFFQFSKQDSKTLLRWEHEREFEYKEQMYDVVKKSEQGDSVLLWCWWDHEETSLNKQLRQLIAQSQANDPCCQEKERRLVCFFLSLFHEDPLEIPVFPAKLAYSASLWGGRHLKNAEWGAPPSPPPDGGYAAETC